MVTTTRATAEQVYYAQAWSLAILDEELFEDDFEAWVHGPVIPSLYERYEGSNWTTIPRPTSELTLSINGRSREILDEVWDTYGQFSAKGLENIVRSEDPWIDARRGCNSGDFCREVISKDVMRTYYAERRRA